MRILSRAFSPPITRNWLQRGSHQWRKQWPSGTILLFLAHFFFSCRFFFHNIFVSLSIIVTLLEADKTAKKMIMWQPQQSAVKVILRDRARPIACDVSGETKQNSGPAWKQLMINFSPSNSMIKTSFVSSRDGDSYSGEANFLSCVSRAGQVRIVELFWLETFQSIKSKQPALPGYH